MSNTSKNYEKIQGVINTLGMLDPIKPTADNAAKLFGIYSTLADVRDDLIRQEKEAKEPAKAEDDTGGEVSE